jgi:hypothetical protein
MSSPDSSLAHAAVDTERFFQMDGNHIVSRGMEAGLEHIGHTASALRDVARDITKLLHYGPCRFTFLRTPEETMLLRFNGDSDNLSGIVGRGGDNPLSFLNQVDTPVRKSDS